MARRQNLIRQRSKFYIITNGKETEYNYFNALKSKKSTYDVCVTFANKDPIGLVQYAQDYLTESNQVWVVFDIDSTYEEKRLVPAIKLVQTTGVKYAFSNLAFEVWLISHFRKCEQSLDTDGHKRLLDEYLNDKKKGLTYEKADEESLCKYFIPYYKTAVNNAKIVYQKKKVEHENRYGSNSQPRIWEWNSCTTVYKLVEALKLSE